MIITEYISISNFTCETLKEWREEIDELILKYGEDSQLSIMATLDCSYGDYAAYEVTTLSITREQTEAEARETQRKLDEHTEELKRKEYVKIHHPLVYQGYTWYTIEKMIKDGLLVIPKDSE